MPRNGSGQYNPLTNTWNPPVTGVLATGADFQAQLNDISAAITQSVSKDGQTPMTANLPMGNNSIIGIASGTETSPSISANGDTNTGLYFPAADTVAIATGGVKRVEVDANGNLGIATTSPTSKLHVKGSFRIESEGAQWFSIGAGSTAASYGAFYKGGTTTSSGFIGTDGGGIVGSGTGDNFGIRAESALLLAAGATERARITSDGNLLVGTTGADPIGGRYNGVVLGSGGNLDIRHASNTSDWGISSTSGTIVNFYSDNGSAAVFAGFISVNGNTTSYASVSDYRLKENIQPMTGALAKVAQLKPCTYNWKADGSDGQGFIAHELQAVFPDAVTGEKDAVDAEGNPKYQGIDTSFLVATLTAAIQEQQALIEAQKTAIESLTARITALEAK